jgi:hypothetical protein
VTTKQGLFLGFGLIGALLLACGGGCGAIAWWSYQGVVEIHRSTENFLALTAAGKNAEAYAASSAALQARVDRPTFDLDVQSHGLTDYSSVSWTSINRTNNVTKVSGTMSTKTGGSFALVATLVKEGDWKVDSIFTVKTLPTDAACRKLAMDSVLAFDAVVKTNDCTAFYNRSAKLWQRQTTPEQLKTGFQDFIDKKFDMAGIRSTQPVFSESPALNKDDRLILKGKFPTKPSVVRFDLKYAYEHPEWKLLSIEVYFAPN